MTVGDRRELLLSSPLVGMLLALSVQCDFPYPFISEPPVNCAPEKSVKMRSSEILH